MIDTSEFRRVLGHFPTGVSVVTTQRADGSPCGLTVNAFASVSLEPSLVMVCVDQGSDSHDCIHSSGFYAVNVLEEGKGETLSRRFASYDVEDKFKGLAYHEAETGAPVLEAALAWVDCRVAQALPVGDHTIFIGEVQAVDARDGRPLVYYRGGYGRFEP
jgi:flavin reductase (DIM6/NTAB) family NADH-FMN oxidoreductase RutF